MMTTDDRDDPEYWNALADRVAAAAVHRMEGDAFAWLGHSRVAWTAACVLGMTALVVAIAMQRSDPGAASVELSAVVAPADSVGRAVVMDRQPPAIGTLLIEQPSRGQR